MDSKDVTHEQAETISRWLVPTMLKLGKLHERMQAKGFPSTDPLMQKVYSAKEATRILRLALHDIERRAKAKPPVEVPTWIKAREAQLPPFRNRRNKRHHSEGRNVAGNPAAKRENILNLFVEQDM